MPRILGTKLVAGLPGNIHGVAYRFVTTAVVQLAWSVQPLAVVEDLLERGWRKSLEKGVS